MRRTPDKLKVKARSVALGNVLLDKFFRVVKDIGVADRWSPVSSLDGMRFVFNHACAFRREPETVDLLMAYVQRRLGGGWRDAFLIEACVRGRGEREAGVTT